MGKLLEYADTTVKRLLSLYKAKLEPTLEI